MPPWFCVGILLTKVICPPLSTLFTGGVKFMISTVSWVVALALGAKPDGQCRHPQPAEYGDGDATPCASTDPTACHPVSYLHVDDLPPLLGSNPRHAARTKM